MRERLKISVGLFKEMVQSFFSWDFDWAKFCWFLCKETFLGHCTRVDVDEDKEKSNNR